MPQESSTKQVHKNAQHAVLAMQFQRSLITRYMYGSHNPAEPPYVSL